MGLVPLLKDLFLGVLWVNSMPYKDPDARKMYQKEYYLKNKESVLKCNRAWDIANKEKVKIYKKEWIKNITKEQRSKYNLRARARYQENIEHNIERKKVYKANNKHIVNANAAKRRACELKRTPAWLTEFDKLKIKCIYSIATMLTHENKELWHVDHIIPLQGKLVSGLHVPTNLQVIPAHMNCKKGNKHDLY